MTDQQFDIFFARLQPVHYLIYHYIKTEYPHALLKVTKQLYQELIPIVYRRIKLRPDDLYTLIRYLILSDKEKISDIEQCEELEEVMENWMVHSDELIFPNLKHLSLGENVIIDSLSPTDEGGRYALQPKLNILTSILKLSSPTTLCIDWPETYGKERSTDPDEGGSLIDWFVPELLHNRDEDTCKLKEIKVHVRYNNIGHMICRTLGYGPEWRPKIKLDMVSPPEASLESILNNVFWGVVIMMNGLIEEDVHFDSTMIGGPFSFNLVDNGNILEAIHTVAEDVWDDYENLFETVIDAITWKNQDNEDEWICKCGKHEPDWKAIKKEQSPTPNAEVENRTQRKIDDYFKPLKNNS